MRGIIIAIVASLVIVAGQAATKPAKPHLHYEVFVGRRHMTPQQRIDLACELAGDLQADLLGQKHVNVMRSFRVRVLRGLVCDMAKQANAPAATH